MFIDMDIYELIVQPLKRPLRWEGGCTVWIIKTSQSEPLGLDLLRTVPVNAKRKLGPYFTYTYYTYLTLPSY